MRRGQFSQGTPNRLSVWTNQLRRVVCAYLTFQRARETIDNSLGTAPKTEEEEAWHALVRWAATRGGGPMSLKGMYAAGH